MKRIHVYDVTLSASWAALTPDQRLELAHGLAGTGADVLEVAAAPVEPDEVRRIVEALPGRSVAVAACATRADVERYYPALAGAERPRMHLIAGASRQGARLKAEDQVAAAREAVALARSLGLEVQFSYDGALSTERRFLTQIYTVAARAGAVILNVPDLTGSATPEEFHDLMAYLTNFVDAPAGVSFGVQCRDSMGLAVAGALAGVKAGGTQVTCALGGAGGEARLEALAVAARTRQDRFGLETGVELEAVNRAARLLAGFIGGSPDLRPQMMSTIRPDMEVYQLESFQVFAGNQGAPVAVVRVSTDEGIRQEAGSGNGPVDALLSAIDRAVGFRGTRLGCQIESHEALAQVTVQVRHEGRVATGHGISADILEGAARAYLHAINQLLARPAAGESDEPAPGWLMRAWGD